MRKILALLFLQLIIVQFAYAVTIQMEDFKWMAPSNLLPPEVQTMPSNNNVSILQYQDRLFMAFRSAPTHFAGTKTKLFIISSGDSGATWQHENTIFLGSDMREPQLYTFQNHLYFMFFEAGKNPLTFTPIREWRTERLAQGSWTGLNLFSEKGEVVWKIKEHNGLLYMASYYGNHYGPGQSDVSVEFRVSNDGINFTPVGSNPVVYKGGVSEIGFEFDDAGNLYATGRNEDGDASGWGSQFFTAPADYLGDWTPLAKSDPLRYDSPKMFKIGSEIYLIARRNLGGVYDLGWPSKMDFGFRKYMYLLTYSFTKKRTAIYHVDTAKKSIEWIQDLPSAGDNAFPDIVKLDENTILLANYSSPLKHKLWTWFRGQTALEGTGVYLTKLKFTP